MASVSMEAKHHPIYIEDDIPANTSHSSYTNPEYSTVSEHNAALEEHIYNQLIADPNDEECCESSVPLAPTETKTLIPAAPSEICVEEKHECPICRLNFGTSLLLERHTKIHTVKDSYIHSHHDEKGDTSPEPHPIYIEDDIPANTSHSSHTNPEYSLVSEHNAALEEHIYNQLIAEPQDERCCKTLVPLTPAETETLRPLAPSKICVEENHECPICRQHFGTSLLLENHIKIHAVNDSYICSDNNEKVDTSSNIQAFPHTHSTEKHYICSHCSKEFRFLSGLKRHIQTHTGEKPYACPHCDKKFSRQYRMERHILTHTGERPYVCPHCGKGFKGASDLRTHIHIHSGERPHVCPHCGKGFIHAQHLRRHILTHTGETPHVCPHCNKGFTTAEYLRTHIFTHTGERPYVCPHCGTGFTMAGNLRTHILIHTAKRPYMCPHCCTGFTQAGRLRTHMFYTHRREASCMLIL